MCVSHNSECLNECVCGSHHSECVNECVCVCDGEWVDRRVPWPLDIDLASQLNPLKLRSNKVVRLFTLLSLLSIFDFSSALSRICVGISIVIYSH